MHILIMTETHGERSKLTKQNEDIDWKSLSIDTVNSVSTCSF
jgi:hypothetical protein